MRRAMIGLTLFWLSGCREPPTGAPTLPDIRAARGGGSGVSMRDLGALGGKSYTSEGWGLNTTRDPAAVQVVGISTATDGRRHGFVWNQSTGMTDVGFLPGYDATVEAWAISDNGIIVGRGLKNGGAAGFVKWPGDALTKLGSLSGSAYTGAVDITTDGAVILGTSDGASANNIVIWEGPGWTLDSIDTAPEVYGISDGGIIVGQAYTWGAALWERGAEGWARVDIGRGAGTGAQSKARDINPTGTIIVGYLQDPYPGGRQKAVFWKKGADGVWGAMEVLQDLPGLDPSSVTSVAWGANNAGDIVGQSGDATGFNHAVSWRPSSGMYGLPVDLGSKAFAMKINGNRQVTGFANVQGEHHAVLWTLP